MSNFFMTTIIVRGTNLVVICDKEIAFDMKKSLILIIVLIAISTTVATSPRYCALADSKALI